MPHDSARNRRYRDNRIRCYLRASSYNVASPLGPFEGSSESRILPVFKHKRRSPPSFQTGQVFEDLYRETHGLPPRRKRVTETDNSGERHSGIELTVEADKEERRACSEGKSSGGLEADPDIARLIALLQERELELDTSNSSVGDAGSGVGSQEDGGTGDGTEKAEGEMDEQATGGDQLDMGGGEGIDIYGGGRWRRGRSNVSGQGHDDAAKSVPTERAGDTRQNERLLCGGREGSAGERERDNSVENLSPEQQQKCRQQLGRIDISRTKIDGTERGAAAGPRPSSAPSAFLSAGGFSRLSRTPSSHFARTVGQKLLHAEKVLAERLLVDAQEEALMKPSLAIAEARVKIDVVRQSADALQVRLFSKCYFAELFRGDITSVDLLRRPW